MPKTRREEFEFAVLRAPSHVHTVHVLAFDMYMYADMRHCTVAVSMSLTVQAKKHTCVDIWIGGAIMYLYMAVSSRVRVGICVYSVPCPYM